MFFCEEERKRAKLKAAFVRDLLNRTGGFRISPFFTETGRDELLIAFGQMAEDIKAAAAKLSEVSGVDAPVLENNETSGFLAKGIVANSKASGIGVDVLLNSAFQQAAFAPWNALQTLERGESEDGTLCPDLVKEAMAGLSGLHAVVNAVPIVYKETPRSGACPVCAVA